MLDGTIYLDHAGTTPYPKSLMDGFAQEMTANLFGNPHSASASSQLSTSRIEDTRLRVLQWFNADPAEFDVVFVANATAGAKLVVEALRAVSGGFDYAYHEASHTSLVGVREEARSSICFGDADVDHVLERPRSGSCTLVAYPGQSNMDGRRLPLFWSAKFRENWSATSGKMYTLLDAAALASTSPLDLSDSESAPDFVVVSFYKIFGFPDLGGLIVRRQAYEIFDQRRYFGGGTVDMVVCLKEAWHASKGQFLHDRLEDGTLPVHNIIALDLAMKIHTTLFGGMARVSAHTSYLARRLREGLASLRHANGTPVCMIYSKTRDDIPDKSLQAGPIVAFNIRSQHAAWVSLTEFEKLATAKLFHIRTGGVCNPGGIASALGLEPWDMKRNFSSGLRCGAENDVMGGRPTGVIRASLGAMSTMEDVDKFIAFVEEFYCDSTPVNIPPSLVTQSAKSVSDLYVDSIIVYPIKSCGGYKVPAGAEWVVRPEGLAWDREWCLVHRGSGQALSQKRHPTMALLRPELDFVHGQLRVTYSGPLASGVQRQISIPLSDNPILYSSNRSKRLTSRVCGDEILAQQYSSDAINAFFTNIIGVPCVLARFPAGGQGRSMRHAKAHLQNHQKGKPTLAVPVQVSSPPSPPDSDSETGQARILLSNESPILSINLSSLAALNQQIAMQGGDPVSSDVFRANIVIGSRGSSNTGFAAPYAEDGWATLQVGQSSYRLLGSCRRCHMVCINQTTADKNQEPFVTLSKTRRFDGKVFFGTHMTLASGSGSRSSKQYPSIKVGASVMPGS